MNPLCKPFTFVSMVRSKIECLWIVEKPGTTYKDIHKLSKRQDENLVFKQNMTSAT